VITQRVYCHTSDLRVFSVGVVPGDERLGFVTHGFVKRALTRNRGPPRRFSTAPCRLEFAAMPSFDASHLGGALALGQ
jgi:hypothetical protein